MPKPVIGDCGGPGQPACPPVPALLTLPDGSTLPVRVHKANGRHFFEEILEDLNKAAGEAFGNRQ